MSHAWEKDGLGIYLFALAMAGILFVHAVLYADNSAVGVPPDEWAHITHVNEVATQGHFLPDYAGSKILLSEKGNYLGHPPLYYTTMGLAGRALGLDPVRDAMAFRVLSAFFVALGLFLWVLIARQIGFSMAWMVPIFLSVNAIPMFPYLSGSVNNDTLAYLAVALAVFGVVMSARWPRASYYWMAIGLLVAILTKMTAGLFVISFLGVWLLCRFSDGNYLRSKDLWIAFGIVVAIGGGYYIFSLVHYGSLAPRVAEAHARNGLPANPMMFTEVARQSWSQMVLRLPEITSHAPTNVVTGKLQWLFLAGLTIPLAALAWLPFSKARSSTDRIAWAFVAALLVNLVAHLVVVWRGYQAYGELTGLQPRYYSFVLPGLFIFCFAAYRRSRATWLLLAAFSMVWLVLLAVIPARSLEKERAKLSVINYLEAGYVDESAVQGKDIEFRGWAVDADSSAAAPSVEIYYGPRLLVRSPTGRPRPDVAAQLGDADATSSGFRIRTSAIPINVSRCDLTVVARQNDGKRVRLRRADCPTR